MLLSRFSSSIGFVGVDFGACGIKMLQVCESAGKLQVVGAARIDVPLLPVSQERDTTALRAGTPASENRGTEPPSARNSSVTASSAVEHTHDHASPAPTADQRLLAQQIRSAFTTGGFTGRKCVVSLARQDVHVASVRLPRMPDDELRQTAMWEAAQRFGLDRKAMEVDFIRTGATLASGENREEIILLAASHAAIHARVEPLLEAGLRPIAVDTGFAALVRSFSRRVRRESDQALIRAVIDIGASGATVLILRGDQIAFCKALSVSGRHFNQAVADHLQMTESQAAELRQARMSDQASGIRDDGQVISDWSSAIGDGATNHQPLAASAASGPDAATERAVYAAVRPLMGEVAKEITLCLRYYGVTFRGLPPERIILTGGDALEPRLNEVIAQACKLPVTYDDAPDELSGLIIEIRSVLNRSPRPAACWATAMGLSLRGIQPAKRPQKVSGVTEGVKCH